MAQFINSLWILHFPHLRTLLLSAFIFGTFLVYKSTSVLLVRSVVCLQDMEDEMDLKKREISRESRKRDRSETPERIKKNSTRSCWLRPVKGESTRAQSLKRVEEKLVF